MTRAIGAQDQSQMSSLTSDLSSQYLPGAASERASAYL
jgi:hypothetical protein